VIRSPVITTPISCKALPGQKIVFSSSALTSASSWVPASTTPFRPCSRSMAMIAPILFFDRYATARSTSSTTRSNCSTAGPRNSRASPSRINARRNSGWNTITSASEAKPTKFSSRNRSRVKLMFSAPSAAIASSAITTTSPTPFSTRAPRVPRRNRRIRYTTAQISANSTTTTRGLYPIKRSASWIRRSSNGWANPLLTARKTGCHTHPCYNDTLIVAIGTQRLLRETDRTGLAGCTALPYRAGSAHPRIIAREGSDG